MYVFGFIFIRGADEIRLTNRIQIKSGVGVDGFGAVSSPNDKRPFNRRPSRPRGRPYITAMAGGSKGVPRTVDLSIIP